MKIQIPNRFTRKILLTFAIMSTLFSACAQAQLIDPLNNVNNFEASYGQLSVTNNGNGTVTLTRLSGAGDGVVNYKRDGADQTLVYGLPYWRNNSPLSLTNEPVFKVTPLSSTSGAAWQLHVFFYQGDSICYEKEIQARTTDLTAKTYDIKQIQASLGTTGGVDKASGYAIRFRVYNGSVTFTEISAQTLAQSTFTAKRTNDFIDSIGVNVHLAYGDTVYGQQYSTIIRPRLQELGIRHVRDAGYWIATDLNYNKNYYTKVNDIASLGIKFLLIMDPRSSKATDTANILSLAPNAISAWSGPNEYDYSGDPNWATTLKTYQPALWNNRQGLPVVGPSFIGSQEQAGDLSAYMTYGDMHSYPGGRYPSIPVSLDQNFKRAAIVSGSKPVFATESGYHTLLHPHGTPQPGVSTTAQGKYIPRLFFEYFNRNVTRTYSYELIDLRTNSQPDNSSATTNDSENNYGLLYNNGTPKPAFTTLKNLISLLKEPQTNFTPGSLAFSLTGNTSNVHKSVLQKSDGTYYLALWLEVPSFDLGSKQDITVPAQSVTVNFNQAVGTVKTYLPSTSTTATSSVNSPGSINVNVTDQILLLEIGKSGVTSPSTNLLSNPSFDAENFDTQTPSGWSEWGAVAASFTETKPRTGARNLTHSASTAYTQCETYQSKTGLTNGLYTLSAYVKNSGGFDDVYMYADAGAGNYKFFTIPTASNWTLIQITGINVTSSQCKIGFISKQAGGKWLLVDDVSFTRQ